MTAAIAPLVTDPADHPVIDGPWWRRQAELCRIDGCEDLAVLCDGYADGADRETVIDWEAS